MAAIAPRVMASGSQAAVAAPSERPYLLAMAGLVSFTCIALSWRDAGAMPRLFMDEWLYSMAARHLPFSEAAIPNYLYYAIYRSTNVCGEAFLQCVHVLNALAFSAGLVFVYAVARQVAGPASSFWVTTLTALSPVNSYAAYFLPEPTYFLAFWAFVWVAVRLRDASVVVQGTCAGAALALLALVKVHGMFLLPAFVVACAGTLSEPSRRWRGLLQATAFAGAAFVIVRLGLGWLFAGRSGLSVLGAAYGEQAVAATAYQAVLARLMSALGNAWLHVVGLVALYGVGLAVLLRPESRPEGPGPSALRFLRLFTLAALATLIVVAAWFNATIVDLQAYESAQAIHARYYNFALPLLPILAAAFAESAGDRAPDGWRDWIGPACLVAILALSWSVLRGRAQVQAIFAPELLGLTARATWHAVLLGVGFVGIVLWLRSRAIALRFHLGFHLPLFTLVSAGVIAQDAWRSNPPGVFDRAGLYARTHLGREDRGHLMVDTGADDPFGYLAARTLFHVDHPDARRLESAEGMSARRDVPPSAHWLLRVGSGEVPAGARLAADLDGFALYKLSGGRIVDFTRPMWPVIVTRVEGLSDFGPAGARPTGMPIRIAFVDPLPSRFSVRLEGSGGLEGPAFALRFWSDDARRMASGVPGSGAGFKGIAITDAGRSLKIDAANIGADIRLLSISIDALE
jgi:phosphoglycerol transferase